MLTPLRKAVWTLPLLFLLLASAAYASHVPEPVGYVNDFAGVLTQQQSQQLESLLTTFEQQTSNEIAIATVKNLAGGDIDDFTVRVFEEWKIGKKDKDNGILFLAAIEDRKMRIEIGYGLEPHLTDGEAGEIIRNIIAPQFKKGDYYQGIYSGVGAIQNQLDSTPTNQLATPNNSRLLLAVLTVLIILVLGIISFFVIEFEGYRVGRWQKWFSVLFSLAMLGFLGIYFVEKIYQLPNVLLDSAMYAFLGIIVFLFIGSLIVYLSSFLARSRSIWAGGLVGFLFGGVGSLLFELLVPAPIIIKVLIAIFFALLLGALGLLLDWYLSRVYGQLKSAGKKTDWWHTGGGFYGGGSGGGGFGGFGGGGSGGGGSSGGW